MDELQKVNINLASLEELTNVPGVGPSLAEGIIADRPYSSLEELTQVQGIGSRSLERLRSYLTAELWKDIPSPQTDPEFLEQEKADVDKNTMEDVIFLDVNSEMKTGETQQDSINIEEENYVETIDTQVENMPDETPIMEENEPVFIPIEDAQSLPPQESAANTYKTESHIPTNRVEAPQSTVTPEAEPITTTWVSRNQLIGVVLLTAFLTMMITVLLTLGILAAVNGGLLYASFDNAAQLQANISRLSDRSETMHTDLEGLRSRLDALETVAGRVSVLELSTTEIQNNLTSAEKTLEKFGISLKTTREEIAVLQKSTQNFQSFINDVAAAAQNYAESSALEDK
jgi:competence ComEA-like helix-hairpin-helix protein